MDSVRPLLPIAALAVSLAACASAPDSYPSLAVRDGERVSGTMQPPPPYIPPPVSAAVADRLDVLTADVAAAHRAFSAEAPAARNAVAATRGAEPGTEGWARAQVALASLEASRGRAMIALADLDRLYVDAAVEAADLTRIAAARDTVAAQVAEQDATIGALSEALPR